MPDEAQLQRTEHGLVPKGDGWFVLNARDALWRSDGRGGVTRFEGEPAFAQVGVRLYALEPGEPVGMYHREAAQEGFLVVAGEALLIVEGQERPLRRWDYVHCPAGTGHVVVGAGETTCLLVAVGSRDRPAVAPGSGWGSYAVDGTALRHGAGVERETEDPAEAYANVPPREPRPFRETWLDG